MPQRSEIAREPRQLPFCVVTDQANAERLAAYFDIVRIIDMRDMQSVNVLRGDSRVTKHGKTVEPAVIHYNVDGQVNLAYLRDIFRLTYEHRPLGEFRARVAALWLRLWYLVQKKGRRINGLRKALFPPRMHHAR